MTPISIETDGRDQRHLIGFATEGAPNALAINPEASSALLYAAAEGYVTDVKALTRPFGYITVDAMESMPAEILCDFMEVLGNITGIAASLMEQAQKLRCIESRVATGSEDA